MTDAQTIKEEYCVENGWQKKTGYRVEVPKAYGDDFDWCFVEEEDVCKGEFWVHKDGDREEAYDNDDLDYLIEQIDDWKDEDEETFEAFKRRRLEELK